jgi:integrase
MECSCRNGCSARWRSGKGNARNLRHAFCTWLSWVAPDAVIERAMRHTSPETKRIYQLSMVEQVREAMEKANQKVYGGRHGSLTRFT